MYKFLALGLVMLAPACAQHTDPAPSATPEAAQNQVLDLLDEMLRNRIEAAGVPPQISVGEELLHAAIALPLFYERRAYRPAWNDGKELLPQSHALFNALRAADREGLHPQDYHLAKIEAALQALQLQARADALPALLVDIDLLLTDAFLIYGSHLLSGKINPRTIDAEWFANRRETDMAEVLQKALADNKIQETLQMLLPPQAGYARMRTALARYRAIAANGDWPMVPPGAKMQMGDRSDHVIPLRQRLIAAGDLEPAVGDTTGLFDDALEQALRKFQRRHGLDSDGVLGETTLLNLNVSVIERIRQVELNLERWRWLPQDLGRRHMLVNIANFELDIFESDEVVVSMRVMVGKDYRRTPVFSDRMTYLVLCPFWHVPPNIAVQDKLPLIKKDPGYLVKQNMKVFQGWGAEAKDIDPFSINWAGITAKNFKYRLRQDPGPGNALGRAKFMFPNPFNVYLHDTPSRELFARTERAFSSGCIRVEKPIDLAEYVLRGDPKWTRANLEAALKTWTEQTVRLPEPIPVHLLYWTAWANEDGSINFRRDIYGRDKLLEAALQEQPPTS